MTDSAIYRLRANVHDIASATARALANVQETLPVGTRVTVRQMWKGSIMRLCLPFDGYLCVKPEESSSAITGYGPKRDEVVVHVDQIELEERL